MSHHVIQMASAGNVRNTGGGPGRCRTVVFHRGGGEKEEMEVRRPLGGQSRASRAEEFAEEESQT